VFALALARLPGIGRARLRRLLSHATNAEVDDAQQLQAFVSALAVSARVPVATMGQCEDAWESGRVLAERCWRHGWHVWALGGTDYPALLTELADPPPFLLVHGPSRLPDVPRVAIVGTREPTPWGEEMAGECARAALAGGALVVSGLAWGIDTAAHAATVACGGYTWAVLPSGLDIIFPPSNESLAAGIVKGGGALVSEYLPGARPRPTFFVERDRLQAALAHVVVVIETGRTGGTHHTIRFARGLGREVWVTLPESAATVAAPDRLPPAQQGTWDLSRSGVPRVEPGQIERWAREFRRQPTTSAPAPATPQLPLF
jgi:DNA processing protein